MSLRKMRIVRIVCLSVGLFGAAVSYLCRNLGFSKIVLVVACVALAAEMVCWFLWRCPHCHRLLHRNTLFAQYCPRCGESLFEG